ncbi:MAG: hypothetical protein ACHREM_33470 [Polyangiales bacterium]
MDAKPRPETKASKRTAPRSRAVAATSKAIGERSAAASLAPPEPVRAMLELLQRHPERQQQHEMHGRAVVLECRIRNAQATLADLSAPLDLVNEAIELVQQLEDAVLGKGRANRLAVQFAESIEAALATNVLPNDDKQATQIRAALVRNRFEATFPKHRDRLGDDIIHATLMAFDSTRADDRAAAIHAVLVVLGEVLTVDTVERALRPSRRNENHEK